MPSPTFSTPDLYDQFEDRCRSCGTQFHQYGGRRIFCGQVQTVQCLDDNVLIRRTLETRSDGGVLVVDGAGYLGSALLGDVMAGLGLASGWAGVIIHGAIRDRVALGKLDFGVKALGTNPKKSAKNGTGRIGVPICFGGVIFNPGEWVYSDEDGILVSNEKLIG